MASLAFVLAFVADNVHVNTSFAFALANVYRLCVKNKLGRGGCLDTVVTGLSYFNLAKQLFFPFFSGLPCFWFVIYTGRHGNIVVCGRQISNIYLSLGLGLGARLAATKRISTLSFSPIFKFWFSSNCIEGFNAVLSFSIAVPKTLMTGVSIAGFTSNEVSLASFKKESIKGLIVPRLVVYPEECVSLVLDGPPKFIRASFETFTMFS